MNVLVIPLSSFLDGSCSLVCSPPSPSHSPGFGQDTKLDPSRFNTVLESDPSISPGVRERGRVGNTRPFLAERLGLACWIPQGRSHPDNTSKPALLLLQTGEGARQTAFQILGRQVLLVAPCSSSPLHKPPRGQCMSRKNWVGMNEFQEGQGGHSWESETAVGPHTSMTRLPEAPSDSRKSNQKNPLDIPAGIEERS